MSPISKPRSAALVAMALLGLAGCGRRGDLEAPSAAAVRTEAKDDIGLHKNAKIVAPKKDFVLDPLLQ